MGDSQGQSWGARALRGEHLFPEERGAPRSSAGEGASSGRGTPGQPERVSPVGQGEQGPLTESLLGRRGGERSGPGRILTPAQLEGRAQQCHQGGQHQALVERQVSPGQVVTGGRGWRWPLGGRRGLRLPARGAPGGCREQALSWAKPGGSPAPQSLLRPTRGTLHEGPACLKALLGRRE